MRPGPLQRRPVRVADVAREAGVSAATVSRILNGEGSFAEATQDRVRAAAERIGFVPDHAARSLRRGRGDSVALLVGDIEQRVYAALARHMQGAVEAVGLDLLVHDLAHDEARLRRFLRLAAGRRLHGIVLATSDELPSDCLAMMTGLAQQGVQVVMLRQPLLMDGVASVVQQEAEAARAATGYLLSLGGRVAFLGRIAGSVLTEQRCLGYRQALLAAGIEPDPAWIWDRSFRYQAGHTAISDALQRGLRPRGILAASDELALGAMAALQDAGLRIPADVAVIGFGNADWCPYVRPALSSVSEDPAALAACVQDLLRTGRAEGVIELPRHIIHRQST